MQDLQWVAQFGFAAVIAIYVLTRLEPTIREQTKAITLLTIVVARGTGQDIEAISRQFGLGNKGV